MREFQSETQAFTVEVCGRARICYVQKRDRELEFDGFSQLEILMQTGDAASSQCDRCRLSESGVELRRASLVSAFGKPEEKRDYEGCGTAPAMSPGRTSRLHSL